MTFLAGLILIAAAVLEVGGDAVVRLGLRAGSPAIIFAGCLAVGCYGLVVNLIKWDFARLLGVYVAVFAMVSVLTGRFLFKEDIPISTWLGLAIIVAGKGVVIQYGKHFSRGNADSSGMLHCFELLFTIFACRRLGGSFIRG